VVRALNNKVAHKEAQEVHKEVLEVHKEVLVVPMEAQEVHKEAHLEEEGLEVLVVPMEAQEVHKEAHLVEEAHLLEVHMAVQAAHKEVHKVVPMAVQVAHKEVPMEAHKEVTVLLLHLEEEDLPHKVVLAHMDLIILVVEARHKEEEGIKFFFDIIFNSVLCINEDCCKHCNPLTT